MNQNWENKTAEDVYQHFDTLNAEHANNFLIYLLQNYPDLEIDWIDMFLEIKEELLRFNPLLIEEFINSYKNIFPGKYENEYEYFENSLITFYLFKNNITKVKERLKIIEKNPAKGIDIVTLRTHFQLLYYGHFTELLEYSKTVWKPIAESNEIWGYPHYHFCTTIYLHELEKNYLKIKSGKQINWEAFLKEMETYDISEDESTFSIISHCLENEYNKDEIKTLVKTRNHREVNLTMNIHFLKYMKEMFNIPFMLSDRFWNIISVKSLFKKKKNTEDYFYIPYKALDKHITEHFDAMFQSNIEEIFGKVWGLEYVYHFIKEHQLISHNHYDLMIENIRAIKYLFKKIVSHDLWKMSFVCNWPKLDKSDAGLRELFDAAYSKEYDDFKETLRKHLVDYEMVIPERLKNEVFNEVPIDINLRKNY